MASAPSKLLWLGLVAGATCLQCKLSPTALLPSRMPPPYRNLGALCSSEDLLGNQVDGPPTTRVAARAPAPHGIVPGATLGVLARPISLTPLRLRKALRSLLMLLLALLASAPLPCALLLRAPPAYAVERARMEPGTLQYIQQYAQLQLLESGAQRQRWLANAFADATPTETEQAAVGTGLPSVARMPRLGDSTAGNVPTRRRKTSFVTSAVHSVGPAVVRIDTERLVDRAPLEGYLPFPGNEGLGPPGQRKESGQGSGLILSTDGLVMTNAHVVKNAAKVTVTLTDGRTFEGTVKGSDDFMDLAAIRIKPAGGKPLPTAPLGRSDELQVGDWVIAIGNAVGLDSTVTLGIVSSLSRSAAEVGIPNKKVNFIQTDAAINPGNSGGPLLNEFGEVIGINTAIRANAAGIGFAIPIDTAEKAMRELSAGRKIAHAYLGISMSSLTPDSARQNNADPNSNVDLPEEFGALVLAVAADTPAAKAGFRKYDLITELDGKKIKTAADAQGVVDASQVGASLSVKIVRQQRTTTLSVTTADLSLRPTNK